MAGEDRVDQLRHHGLVVADDAGKERLLPAQPLRQVVAHLVPHGPAFDLAARDRRLELSERFNAWRRRHISIMTLDGCVGLGHRRFGEGRWPSGRSLSATVVTRTILLFGARRVSWFVTSGVDGAKTVRHRPIEGLAEREPAVAGDHPRALDPSPV